MLVELLIAAIATFIATFLSGFLVKPLLISLGLVSQDINKKNRPILPTSGGIVMMIGIFVGLLALTLAQNYIGVGINAEILVITLLTALSIAFIGFVDDVSGSAVRTSRADIRKIVSNYKLFNGGIKQWQKPLLTLIAALPLLTINFGPQVLLLPHIGYIYLNQFLYAFVLVPLAIVFSANAFNMLEGLNGISAQMGLVAFGALSVFTYHIQEYTSFATSTIFVAALAAYLYYGKYPAKILPGDSLTYLIGGGFAAAVLTSGAQVLGAIIVIPWLIECLLKARKRFHANSWGLIQKDGTLRSPHEKIYSSTHIFMKTGRLNEWQIALLLTGVEVLFSAFALAYLW